MLLRLKLHQVKYFEYTRPMIRTLKRTLSDVAFNPNVTNPAGVDFFTRDLTDLVKSNIRPNKYGAYVDNSDYIGKVITSVIDVMSLFAAVNNVVDDTFKKIKFTKAQGELELIPIYWPLREMMLRYEHFHLWFKNSILIPDIKSISIDLHLEPDEIEAIKTVIKNQYSNLNTKLDRYISKITAFLNKYQNTRFYIRNLEQLEKINNELQKLRGFCKEGLNFYKPPTLKKAVSDITRIPSVSDPERVALFIKDLSDFSESNIMLDMYGQYVDNSEYIDKAITSAIDALSLFEALNNVVDDNFSKIKFTPKQGVAELGTILNTYIEMILRYEHFHLWFKTKILLEGTKGYEPNSNFSPEEISVIMAVIKNQYSNLIPKLDTYSSQITAFVKKYQKSSIYEKKLFQMNKISEELQKLRVFCVEGLTTLCLI